MRQWTVLMGLIFALLRSDCVLSQQRTAGQYTISFKEEVLADYSNLLDTAKSRNYKLFKTEYEAFVSVDQLNSNQLLILFEFKSLHKQDSLSVAGLQLSFLLSRDLKAPGVLYLNFEEQPSSETLSYCKGLVSNFGFIFFREYDSGDQSLAFQDGLFRVKTKKLLKDGIITIERKKSTIYKPGVSVFRTIIDNYTAAANIRSEDSIAESAHIYEEKRQKIGGRTLSTVTTTTRLSEVKGQIQIGVRSESGKFPIVIPVYRQSKYLERAERNARQYQLVQETTQLLVLLENLKDNDLSYTGDIYRMIRSSIILGALKQDQVRLVLQQKSATSSAFKVLENALIESGTSGAQQLLAAMLKSDTLSLHHQKEIIIKIGVSAPVISPALTEVIKKVKRESKFPDLSSAAGLALANNALVLAEDKEQSLRNDILFFLEDCFLHNSQNSEDTLQWLEESGNAGNENVLPLVADIVRTKDTVLYNTALRALRFLPGDAVDSLLSSELHVVEGEGFSVLISVLKLRYPSALIRQAIYKRISDTGQEKEWIKDILDYLATWADDEKEIIIEVDKYAKENQSFRKYWEKYVSSIK